MVLVQDIIEEEIRKGDLQEVGSLGWDLVAGEEWRLLLLLTIYPLYLVPCQPWLLTQNSE